MGLLDAFLQTAGEGGTPADPTQHAALYAEVAKIVAQEGGVPGMAQKFEANGLGGLVSGLMASPPAATPAPASDPNAATSAPADPSAAAPTAPAAGSPLTGDHIVQLLGPDRIQEIAGKVGLSEQQVATGISTMLPLIMSHLSAQGGAAGGPTASSEIEGMLFGELKTKLFGA